VPQAGLPSKTADVPSYVVVRLPQPEDAALDENRKPIPVEQWAPVKVEFAKDNPEGAPETFKATITLGDGKPPANNRAADPNPNLEEYPGLTVLPGAAHFASVINKQSTLVAIADPDKSQPFSQRVFELPQTLALAPPASTDLVVPDKDALKGDPANKTGLGALDGIDEITMVCVPDLMAVNVDNDGVMDLQSKVEEYCIRGKRMAIHDPPAALDKQEIFDWRMGINTNSPWSTLYWPWIRVTDPLTKAVIEVPPCGHVAGVWAGTDNRRGVHKAPANEVVGGAVGVALEVSNPDQEQLNTAGINVIREFPGRGVRIWGARTLATKTDPEWRYISVRRLFNYVSASILEGTGWAVFEPNDEVLWSGLRVSVGNFLMGVWRGGALFGATPDEAFFVKCDRDTNPQDAIDAGQVNIYIGIAPVKPAEFVIFSISQYTAAAS
jgi:hypothetical protein